LFGLPLGLKVYGLVGCIVVVILADVVRYIPICFGQSKERFSFGLQDLLFTLLVFLLTAGWQWVRWSAGFGTSFNSFPMEVSSLFPIGCAVESKPSV
jgi:hypothetical protein